MSGLRSCQCLRDRVWEERINIIVLVGESASGKSTIEKELANNHGYQKIISYTTRPPRINEVDGIDYHFVTDEKFEELSRNYFFCEVGKYRGWNYGSSIEDCKRDRMVAVLTPHGLRQVEKIKGLDIVSFYISVPIRERLIKILQRGDEINECFRRSMSDVGMFDGIEDDVDFIIKNDGYMYSAKAIADEIENLVREKGGDVIWSLNYT